MSNVFTLDFKRGILVPMRKDDLLPVGSLVTYEDMANPQKKYVVTEATIGEYGHGQKLVCEDGHVSQVHASSIDKYGRTAASWHFVRDRQTDQPVVLSPELMAVFLANAETTKARLHAERIEAEAKKKREDDAERARIIAEYPYLERVGETKKSGHALAASNLKKLLAREFPGQIFKITSKSYSGGSSVDCHWLDGPTSPEVDKLADRFQECDFDGMDDSTHYRNSVWTEIFGGAKYVHGSRTVSHIATAEVAAEMGYVITFENYSMRGVSYEIEQMINREVHTRSFYNQ